MKLIRTMFPLRHCRNMNAKRPCLQYHLHRCLAPCTGKVPVSEYRQMVDAVLLLLDGKVTQLEKDLTAKMQHASDNLEFEAAARYRDSLLSLRKLAEKQKPHRKSANRDWWVGRWPWMTAESASRCSSSQRKDPGPGQLFPGSGNR